MNRSPLNITVPMLNAGALALDQARTAGHDDRATCHIVFAAMISESAWQPGARVRPSKPQFLKGRKLPSRLLTRADFNADGVRVTHRKDGTLYKQLLQNFWYLNPPYTKL